jgi:hypothetical protein
MNERMVHSAVLDDRWLKAAVTGSLWASFEIIAGSFLHNLRVPFAGTILTALAVVFLIAIFQIWPQRGIILRAGIICALMKSISPSAVILGPMIGIFTEALLIEFAIFILGRNVPAYLLAGALAVLSTLIHKLVKLLILYGNNLVDVYINLVNYISSQVSIPGLSASSLIWFLVIVYSAIGFIAAATGFYIGKRSASHTGAVEEMELSGAEEQKNFEGKQSLVFLVGHLLVIPGMLYLLSGDLPVLIKTGFVGLYLGLNIFRYRNVGRKLLKPGFWIQIGILMILAALFLENSASKEFSWKNGLLAGYLMLLRAILLITAFSKIGYELSNPVIRDFLIKNGFNKVYLSLRLAFSALPMMLDKTPRIGKMFRNPLLTFSSILTDANSWLEAFRRHKGDNG